MIAAPKATVPTSATNPITPDLAMSASTLTKSAASTATSVEADPTVEALITQEVPTIKSARSARSAPPLLITEASPSPNSAQYVMCVSPVAPVLLRGHSALSAPPVLNVNANLLLMYSEIRAPLRHLRRLQIASTHLMRPQVSTVPPPGTQAATVLPLGP